MEKKLHRNPAALLFVYLKKKQKKICICEACRPVPNQLYQNPLPQSRALSLHDFSLCLRVNLHVSRPPNPVTCVKCSFLVFDARLYLKSWKVQILCFGFFGVFFLNGLLFGFELCWILRPSFICSQIQINICQKYNFQHIHFAFFLPFHFQIIQSLVFCPHFSLLFDFCKQSMNYSYCAKTNFFKLGSKQNPKLVFLLT